jgi:hypothetical protein
VSANCFNEFATDTFATPIWRNRYLVNRCVTVFAATKVNEANNRAGVQACKRARIFGNCNEQAAFLDGFLKCGKFDETQLMPMLVCQSLDSLQLTPLCQPNLNIHANHPLKTQIFSSAKFCHDGGTAIGYAFRVARSNSQPFPTGG